VSREEQLERLASLNGALARMGAVPYVTVDEAVGMTDDILEVAVLRTAARVVKVAAAVSEET
jgi:hypothetical protein